jgi:hypothetical protein
VTWHWKSDVDPPADSWGAVHAKLDAIARVGERRYVLRGRHRATSEPVEVPIGGGVTFEMLWPKPPSTGSDPAE